MVEVHADLLVVNILVKIKNIDLDIARHAIDSWPVADVGHAFISLAVYLNRYRENAISGDELIG